MIRTMSLDAKRVLLASIMALAVLLAVLLVRPGGIGGTGIGGGEGGGLGGTGVGTGFIGRIDSFGSIWVNGTEIFYDDDIPVMFGGREGTASALAVGHVVQVVAKPDVRGVYRARSLAVRYEIAGQVQSQVPGSVTISDQRVLLPGTISSPRPGDIVAVSGFRRSDGVIVASHIDTVDAANPVVVAALDKPFKEDIENLSLSGYMQGNADGYSLYGYRIDTVPNDFVPQRLTTVTAKPSAGGLTIINMRQHPDPDMSVPQPSEPDGLKPDPKPVPIKAPQEAPQPKRLDVPRPDQTPKSDQAPRPQPAPRNRPEPARPEGTRVSPERQQMQGMEAPSPRQDMTMHNNVTGHDNVTGQDNITDEQQRNVTGDAETRQQNEEPKTPAETQIGTEQVQDERNTENSTLPEMETDVDPDAPDMNPNMSPQRADMPPDEPTPPERDTRPDMQTAPQRPERTDRVQPPRRVDRPERLERPERPMRPERPDRPERPERPGRPR